MLKLAQTDRPTDRPTDQQTGQKQYVPHYYNRKILDGYEKQTQLQDLTSLELLAWTKLQDFTSLELLAWTKLQDFTTVMKQLRSNTHQKDFLSNVAPNYLSKLTNNLKNRFIETEILECMKCDGKTDRWTDVITFELYRSIIETNLLTKFHEDRTRNVGSKVFTRKTAPPTGGHVFHRAVITVELNQHTIKTNILTNFKLDQGIIGTNLLTTFHEDLTRYVASRVFTNQMCTADGQMTDKDQSQKLT
ncbi:hypothetical protein DPMN_119342 [Dreissena polymorpha]|uniref:Uncharacterized protein n=1 Tax=Dreissena polymorpha TaxID=45954 RepID=A0A9D4GPS7_DREPO|nr:hypothetical protein DPMN_119342 [Dreissena polymorpha]